MIKKLLLVSLAIFAIYYGGKYYVVFRLADLMPECVDMKVLSEMDKENAPREEKIRFAREGWSCIKEKQNIFDKAMFWAFFKIPDTWLVQPTK
ncbi:MAG: hypothetical protein Q7U84_07780 [Polynucleobacter sp.]|nr:hypothetical protein [Polynucleobacter sp.]